MAITRINHISTCKVLARVTRLDRRSRGQIGSTSLVSILGRDLIWQNKVLDIQVIIIRRCITVSQNFFAPLNAHVVFQNLQFSHVFTILQCFHAGIQPLDSICRWLSTPYRSRHSHSKWTLSRKCMIIVEPCSLLRFLKTCCLMMYPEKYHQKNETKYSITKYHDLSWKHIILSGKIEHWITLNTVLNVLSHHFPSWFHTQVGTLQVARQGGTDRRETSGTQAGSNQKTCKVTHETPGNFDKIMSCVMCQCGC